MENTTTTIKWLRISLAFLIIVMNVMISVLQSQRWQAEAKAGKRIYALETQLSNERHHHKFSERLISDQRRQIEAYKAKYGRIEAETPKPRSSAVPTAIPVNAMTSPKN
jgi:hypothetical protein